MKLKKLYISILILTISIIIFGCKKETKYEIYSKTYFEYFNTVCTISGYEENKEDFINILNKIEPLLEKYHKLYDIYYEYSGVNNICRINKNAGIKAIEVDEEIINLINYSKQAYQETNGNMNIAMGSVLKLWHEEREYASSFPLEATIPNYELLKEASLHTNINDIEINDANKTVYLKDKKMSLDVGAIAKGYVAEQISKIIIDLGKTSYIVNLGGNIRLIGSKPNDEKWNVGIQNPDLTSENKNIKILEIADYSIVTSGTYQRYYEVDGIRYHHIIDPVTLMPKNDYQSVTILTKNSALADTLSTALFNISIEDGKKILNKYADTYAMWIDKNNQIHYSNGFEKFILGD